MLNIDNWLFRWADNRPECEPESYKCSVCENYECYYWSDFNEEKKKMLSVNDINFLESQNDGLRKQNDALQNSFLKILKICEEPADNLAVAELQSRIKVILNGKNN